MSLNCVTVNHPDYQCVAERNAHTLAGGNSMHWNPHCAWHSSFLQKTFISHLAIPAVSLTHLSFKNNSLGFYSDKAVPVRCAFTHDHTPCLPWFNHVKMIPSYCKIATNLYTFQTGPLFSQMILDYWGLLLSFQTLLSDSVFTFCSII